MKIDISKLNKALVLACLYNCARPQGLGLVNYSPDHMSRADAEKILAEGITAFDYLRGRVMKVDVGGDQLETELYDRDNGKDGAYLALRHLLLAAQQQ